MILRDYCVDWIIGWVACWIAFISVFFFSRKIGFKKVARHLLDTLLFVELLKLFHIAIPTTPRYLVDWLRKLLPPPYLLDTWWIDRASVLGSDELFLDTCSIPRLSTSIFLDTYLDSFLDTSRHLICRVLLSVLYKPPCAIQTSFHSISLLIALCFLSQTLSKSLQSCFSKFLQAFSRFSSLGELLISHSSCISCFETKVLGFLKNFGVFQNCWVIVAILGWVMLMWSQNFMHCITYAL